MAHFDAIFMMGPQGAGKGTQSKIFAERLGFFHWEMGAILRSMRPYRLKTGRSVGEIIDPGGFLEDDELIEIVGQKLSELPEERGIIFDGIPRRLGQAQFLIEWLRARGKNDLATVFLDIPREESVRRVMERSKTDHRAEDTPEALARRLEFTEKVVMSILPYMKEQTKFFEIDGAPPIPEVTAKIAAALEL